MSGDSIAISNPISDRWLGRVRGAWYVAAFLSLAIVFVSIPEYIRAVPEGFSVIPFAPNPSPVVLAVNALSALLSLASVLLCLYLAFLLFRRRPKDRMALFLSFYLLAFGVFSGPFEMLDLVVAASITSYAWHGIAIPLIMYPTSCFLFLLFPDGRFAPAWSRWLAWACLITAPIMAISWLIRPWPHLGSGDLFALVTSSILPVAIMTGVLYALFLRYRHIASGQQKQQIKWAVYGLGILLFVQVATSFPYYWSFTLPADTQYPIWLAPSTAFYVLSLAALPVSLTIAVMRHRLYDIDILINRTLVYGGLSLLIAAMYVLTIVGVGAAFQRSSNLVSLLLATLLAFPLIRPAHRLLQRGADRLVPIGADLSLQRSTSDEPFPEPSSGMRMELAVTDDAPVTTSASWSARKRSILCAAWYLAAFLSLVITIAAVPGYIQAVPEGFSVIPFAPNPSPMVLAINALGALFSVATVLLSIYLAFLLFHRRYTDRMAMFLSFYLLAFGTLSGPIEFLGRFLNTGLTSFVWKLNVILFQMIIFTASCFLFVLFPDGRFAPSWSRRVAMASLITSPVMVIGFLIWSHSDPRPLAALIISSIAPVVIIIGALYALIYRYRNIATRQQRQQIKWVVYGLGIMLFIQFATAAPYFWSFTLPADIPYPAWLAIVTALYFLSFAALPVSLTIAVMRHRLYDIDLLINRTLVYGGLSLLIAALYVLVVGGLGTLFQVQGNLIIALLATGLVAVLFQPLRARIQGGVNRLIFGERNDPMLALSNLGEKLETAVPPDEVMPTVVQTVASTLKLPYVAISLRENEGMKIVAEHGKAVVETISLPLAYQGERIGQMLVALRSHREPFSPDELKLLSNVARQASVAAHAVQLTADLQRSRERLVTAREEERRRLRRDLHDGLGPAMASQTLKLDAALDLILGDPTSGQEQNLKEATKILKELQAQTQDNVKSIRQIVYALRPPALDDLGLIPAIETHIEQLTRTQNHLYISVEIPEEGLPPLSAAVELAIYRIAIEALTNVINHAQARDCTVRISISEDHRKMLNLDVIDDGVGLPENLETGVGLTSMHERAEELGGVFKIETSPSMGTRVSAQIPFLPVEGA